MDPGKRAHKEAKKHEMPPIDALYTIRADDLREPSNEVQLFDQISSKRHDS